MLSIDTAYAKDTGSPVPYLRRIAEAGFSHIHWSHHWHTDFMYSDSEIDQIDKWLQEYGLQLNDLHASEGKEKSWVSPLEYQRLAGVELVKNRINMAARLSSDVIIMHVRAEPRQVDTNKLFWTQLQQSLDALEPYAKAHRVRIAVENLFPDNFDTLEKIFTRYGPDYIGLCYDSGHGSISNGQMDRLERIKDRLISIHLNDNDGASDQHKLPFSGTVDWTRLARIIAESAYAKCVNLEVMIRNTGIEDEPVFLEKAFESGTTFARLVEEHRQGRRL